MSGPARPLRRVRLAVSMGDPGGIGPEVALKALASRTLLQQVDPVLVGDAGVWRDAARRLGLSLAFAENGQRKRAHAVALAVTSELPRRARVPGLPRTAAAAAAAGAAAYAAICGAFRLVQDGAAAALVTAPISKAHLVAAGHDFPGHTELLAQLSHSTPVRMMMVGSRLRVVLVTTHVALADVPRQLSRAGVFQTIGLTARALRGNFGIPAPRIAVTGLNPHAGEHGLFGSEEARVIRPAVQLARRRGVDVHGPVAADSLFPLAAAGTYDAVVCMYHDQGLAPFKLLHFADGVNLTLGLPFVRTSPDHGTAFDIAGTGHAAATSMRAALQLAARLARNASALEKRATAAVG
ncbi:MAG: 4-hydroxythreonine-4-phosphate dehydrogenase PdxA [Candidatus Binatia bacterium]